MKPPEDMARRRALGIAGAASLMVAWVAVVLMIAGALSGGDDDLLARGTGVPSPAKPTPTPTPSPTPTPEPTPVPLTPEQRAARETAAQLVRDKGFEPVKLRHYDPTRTLRVLIGRSTAGMKLAFFFVGDDYIGNDTSSPSAQMRIIGRSDTQVTLGYGTPATAVRFKWDGARLAPLDPVPAVRQ